MRILMLTQAFNSLAQRLFVELRADGHDVSVELDIADSVTEEAVARWQPDVLLAPFLKRRIPESTWSTRPCLVVHPGPPGDAGPSALDWAIETQQATWGVTVLQATGDYDAGPVWAWRRFAMRAEATKSSLYRREVVDAAVDAVRDALARGGPVPRAVGTAAPDYRWQPAMTQAERALRWQAHDTDTVLRRIRAADGSPGLADGLFGQPCHLFDAHRASAADLAQAPPGAPGEVVARRGPAVLRRTVDGAVWIGHVRRARGAGEPTLKLETTQAYAAEAAGLPECPVPLQRDAATWDELRYREVGPSQARVGIFSFDFHQGAINTRQARRWLAAWAEITARPTRVLLVDGGADFFCNGIHLHTIEAAQLDGGSAADASLAHIEAIDDVALALLTQTDRLVVAALRGNAGAGGCFLALAADEVWAHGSVVQNPHYKNMGNLHGSEYWTYLLPRRVGPARARHVMHQRLPMGAREAHAAGLVDAVLTDSAAGFDEACLGRAMALAADPGWAARVDAKARQREADERLRPLAAYREDELRMMRKNFFGFDASYHVARHHFVHRKPHAWTPRHLAIHR